LAASKIDSQKRRFGAYFPRAFACAYSLTGDETVARDIVSEAFVRVFAHPAELAEEEFIVELFTTARDLSRASCAAEGRNAKLTGREHEVLAFVFDARLSREEIRRLMGTTEQGLSATLLRALRKLQAGISPAAITA
jgi:DNA-directed RNA polymerase specialized sigma24 family protein